MDHFRAQMRLVASGNREGGFFLMIGRKPLTASPPGSAPPKGSVHDVPVEPHAV